MLKYLKKNANKFMDDVAYNTGRIGAVATGKTIIEIGAAQVLTTLGLLAAGVSAGSGMMLFSLVAVPLLGAFSVGLAELDHMHRRSRLKNQYREEVAAKLGKKPLSVTEADLELVAKGDPQAGIEGNKVLAEALSESRKERNISSVISVISTIAVFFAVKFLASAMGIHADPKELTSAFGAGEMGAAASQLGGFAMKGLLAVAAYYAIKTPLHWVGGELLGLEKETTNEKIIDIKRDRRRGREVTQEQVFELYADTNPELQNAIRYEYGHSFHHLRHADQAAVVKEANAQLPIEELTADLNANRIRPEELAFATQFQESGVKQRIMESRPVVATKNMFSQLRDKMHDWMGATTPVAEAVETAAHQAGKPVALAAVTESADKSAQMAMEGYADEKAGQKRSFVEMVGRKSTPGMEALTHVERLQNTETLGEIAR